MQALQSVRPISEHLWVGGQPKLDEFAEIKKLGVTHVINLRPEEEMSGFDEGEYVELMGMTYTHLPIRGLEDLTPQQAEKLHAELQAITEGVVLVHCASGNRVGALFAIHAFFILVEDVETSIQVGRIYGLTKLEPMVYELLNSMVADQEGE